MENLEEITAFASRGDVQKKRASLVLLTRAVRESNERQLADLAFANIQKLKSNRDILITKAISWLLRDLIKHHRIAVEDFVQNNRGTLPKIAIRETKTKLLTGKKTSRLKVTPSKGQPTEGVISRRINCEEFPNQQRPRENECRST